MENLVFTRRFSLICVLAWKSTIELGIQAGVFAIFDLDSQSFDMINADYLVGIPFTIKKGNCAAFSVIFVGIDKNE